MVIVLLGKHQCRNEPLKLVSLCFFVQFFLTVHIHQVCEDVHLCVLRDKLMYLNLLNRTVLNVFFSIILGNFMLNGGFCDLEILMTDNHNFQDSS